MNKINNNKSKAYLPPEDSSQEPKKKHSSKLGRAIKYLKNALPKLGKKSASYQVLTNQQEQVGTSKDSGKAISERSASISTPKTPTSMVTSVDVPPPESIDAKRQMLVEASIAAYPYYQSSEIIADAYNVGEVSVNAAKWQPASEFIEGLAKKTNLQFDSDKGFLFDKKTGLTAYILKQPGSNEIRLVFGGTTSGKKASKSMLKRSLFANPSFTLRQWVSNFKNVTGNIPKNFSQAKNLTTELNNILSQNEEYKNYHLVLSGHSKGGAEATYAALSQERPLEARVFSSAELHQKLINEIPKENLLQACKYIKGVSIKGDFVPVVGKIIPVNIRSLGESIVLPPAHFYNLERHDSYLQHIRYFAEENGK